MTVYSWPEIPQFHNVSKYIKEDESILRGVNVIWYKAKVKLHGTNAGVQCFKDGTVVPQSRETVLSVEKDNYGFAKFVKETEEHWKQVAEKAGADVVVYGEWFGKGVQKGVACSEIDKSFAVFAIKSIDEPTDEVVEPKVWMVEPDDIEKVVSGIPNTYTLPWYEISVQFDWKSTDEVLTKVTEEINIWISDIEKEDPWIQEQFNISGTGEGLVFYPVTNAHVGYESFKNLTFKAKGEAHKTISKGSPAQVSPEKAGSVDEFVNLVLTESRLEQGANKIGSGYDITNVGKFIGWVTNDVKKETSDELQASGLNFDDVQKSLVNKAREWYLAKAKS